ncbi:unnamed protein product [Echinostoma caproni]|uniref:Uncharacterized protein n=1 Tax=Echinostoma caproni TaxID=27848 RepID=A0A183B1T6_9TREM|nr:unnamed protein product [Echinostoma caproni]
MPGRPMGDICQLYYSIAAPFKAPPRTKSHADLINQCFARAVRAGRVANRWVTQLSSHRPGRSAVSAAAIHCRNPGDAEDPLEREFEMHLVGLVGMSKARRLLGRRMLSTPYPLWINQNPSASETCAGLDSRANSPTRVLPFTTRPIVNGHAACLTLPTFTCVDYSMGNGSSGASSQLGSESTTHSRQVQLSIAFLKLNLLVDKLM